MRQFTAVSVGCWIDGAFGEDHAVAVLVGMLARIEDTNAHAAQLLTEVPESGDEFISDWQDAATDALQESTAEGLTWDWNAGDLCLCLESELEGGK